jgi:ribosome-binding protein aMBF1 (putative translation factor)
MDTARLKDALDTLDWSRRQLAKHVGCSPAIVDRWALNGKVPPDVEVWLEVMTAFRKANPPPADWKRRRKSWK